MDVMLEPERRVHVPLPGQDREGLLVRLVATSARTCRSSIELYKEGKLKLEELVSREIGVDGVNEAFTAMQAGEVARSLITHDALARGRAVRVASGAAW